jgi:DNA-binding YbaB/EbfC family protein
MSMDMNKMLQQVQQMQQQMLKAQEELKNETVEASAGGGMVTVKVSGALEVLEVRISPEAIDPEDPETLGDMVVAATNEALRSAQGLMEQKLGPAMGGLSGLGLPGF